MDNHFDATTCEEKSMCTHGRLMALDLGEKRIGVAISDESQLLARTYAVVQRSSRKEDFRQLAEIVLKEQVCGLVVGLPIRLDGTEGQLAVWIRDYTQDLATHLNLPCRLWDESFTTKEAESSMRARGKNARQQRDWIDAVAAAMLLQNYLDAQERESE